MAFTYMTRAEIIATTKCNNGSYLVTLWDYNPNHHPEKGIFKPIKPETLPTDGEGIYLVVKDGNKLATITPIEPYKKGE